jgi:hypothetical protein
MGMRIATGFAASAVVLLGAGAIGVLGPWALGAGAVLVLLTAVVATTAMERRDRHLKHDDMAMAQRSMLRRAA